MIRGVVVGRSHRASENPKREGRLDPTGYDAVFLEAHEKDYFARELTGGYVLYLVGHLLYALTVGRFQTSPGDLRERAAERGVPVHDVDADVHETYELVPHRTRVVLLCLAPVGASALLTALLLPVYLALRPVTPLLAQVIVGVLASVAFGFAWALVYFGFVEDRAMAARDDYMSERIRRITEQNGYRSVLVACGDRHRTGIATHLETEGWSVEERPSRTGWVDFGFLGAGR